MPDAPNLELLPLTDMIHHVLSSDSEKADEPVTDAPVDDSDSDADSEQMGRWASDHDNEDSSDSEAEFEPERLGRAKFKPGDFVRFWYSQGEGANDRLGGTVICLLEERYMGRIDTYKIVGHDDSTHYIPMTQMTF